ncbi:hypothetical protein BKA67DRAFT_658151 [Truncatella angustata]|uniref:Uncharacterized protein n=1 Tax=Truncatella angustata TaxID=152316 RepID=A0A9P8ZY93_9PEZI|nr:uncharacterized protein BKA67DRAFT_658151 [Truncatella angustata]KAH6653810.1 hypothetical protein BKA67DRAFT_658151 [Truncatella angustata]
MQSTVQTTPAPAPVVRPYGPATSSLHRVPLSLSASPLPPFGPLPPIPIKARSAFAVNAPSSPGQLRRQGSRSKLHESNLVLPGHPNVLRKRIPTEPPHLESSSPISLASSSPTIHSHTVKQFSQASLSSLKKEEFPSLSSYEPSTFFSNPSGSSPEEDKKKASKLPSQQGLTSNKREADSSKFTSLAVPTSHKGKEIAFQLPFRHALTSSKGKGISTELSSLPVPKSRKGKEIVTNSSSAPVSGKGKDKVSELPYLPGSTSARVSTKSKTSSTETDTELSSDSRGSQESLKSSFTSPPGYKSTTFPVPRTSDTLDLVPAPLKITRKSSLQLTPVSAQSSSSSTRLPTPGIPQLPDNDNVVKLAKTLPRRVSSSPDLRPCIKTRSSSSRDITVEPAFIDPVSRLHSADVPNRSRHRRAYAISNLNKSTSSRLSLVAEGDEGDQEQNVSGSQETTSDHYGDPELELITDQLRDLLAESIDRQYNQRVAENRITNPEVVRIGDTRRQPSLSEAAETSSGSRHSYEGTMGSCCSRRAQPPASSSFGSAATLVAPAGDGPTQPIDIPAGDIAVSLLARYHSPSSAGRGGSSFSSGVGGGVSGVGGPGSSEEDDLFGGQPDLPNLLYSASKARAANIVANEFLEEIELVAASTPRAVIPHAVPLPTRILSPILAATRVTAVVVELDLLASAEPEVWDLISARRRQAASGSTTVSNGSLLDHATISLGSKSREAQRQSRLLHEQDNRARAARKEHTLTRKASKAALKIVKSMGGEDGAKKVDKLSSFLEYHM